MWYLRPNYFIFIEYLKTGGGGGREGVARTREPPMDPPLIHFGYLLKEIDIFLKHIEITMFCNQVFFFCVKRQPLAILMQWRYDESFHNVTKICGSLNM